MGVEARKTGLVQTHADSASNQTFGTCKEACQGTGGMCMACGPDMSYSCGGCCCFHWPMGPKCPNIPNSKSASSPSYTLNFNCVGPHLCEPQNVCGGEVQNLKYASMKPLTETNVKCSWAQCMQCEMCKKATGMGSWARNGANCKVHGKQ